MALTINLQENSMGIVNHATGNIVTDAVAAAAATITLGFAPRVVRFHNLTDRISDEWFAGMVENAIYVSLLGITAKLDADGGVTDTNYAALWNPASADLTLMKAAIVGINAKLDADAGVTGTNYTSLWTPGAATAAVLRATIAGINAKLDADGGVTDTNFAALWDVAATRSLHTVANGTRTFDVTNGIAVDGNTFTLTATTMVASKQFYWEAIG